MTYVPNRITRSKLDVEEFLEEVESSPVDEMVIDANLLQRNLDLISRETKELRGLINASIEAGSNTRRRLQNRTEFVNAFLFG